MPGSIPGLPGFAAFAGLKFVDYVLAGAALKKLQPAIHLFRFPTSEAKSKQNMAVRPRASAVVLLARSARFRASLGSSGQNTLLLKSN